MIKKISRGTKVQKTYIPILYDEIAKLMFPHLKKYLSIEVSFQNTFSEGAYGFCNYYPAEKKPRKFLIELDQTLQNEDLEKTFLHELIHVKQYARKELQHITDTQLFWKSKKIYTKNMNEANFPWEKEAERLTDKIYSNIF